MTAPTAMRSAWKNEKGLLQCDQPSHLVENASIHHAIAEDLVRGQEAECCQLFDVSSHIEGSSTGGAADPILDCDANKVVPICVDDC